MTSKIAATLDFSEAIKHLANKIISHLTMGQAKYNSVHLRIEKDARDWAELMEGQLVRHAPLYCYYSPFDDKAMIMTLYICSANETTF